jgi:hypothetical protein
MNKHNVIKQPLASSPENAKKKLPIDLERYLEDPENTTIMSKYAGSIEFSDDEFSAMLQELKEDK